MAAMNEENTRSSGEIMSLGTVITIVQDVLKHWYLIVAVALIAAMAAYVWTDAAYTPTYSTTTTFVASASGTSTTTFSNLTSAQNLASVFTELLNSSILRKEVMKQTGISYFDGRISTSAIAETNLLTMTVSGSDPRTVFLMTRGIIEHHDIVSGQVLNNTILEVLQEPTVPMHPSNPINPGKTITYAAGLGAAVMCALLAALSLMSDRIRSRAEADTKLSCHVLGELYHEKKRGASRSPLRKKKSGILITNPLTSFLYTESVHKLASRVEKRRHRGERIILVTSVLENEGKSTVAVNLALSLAKKNRKVLLIDCDIRKPACGLILEMPQKAPGIVEVLSGKERLAPCIQKVKNSNLDVLISKKSLTTAIQMVSSPAMEALLKEAATYYDFVVVDTPPMSIAPDAECLSAFADASLLVVRQNTATAGSLNDAITTLEKNTHVLGCVLNNVFGAGNFAPAFSYGSYSKYGRYGYGYGNRK